jgi:hypothetical protein
MKRERFAPARSLSCAAKIREPPVFDAGGSLSSYFSISRISDLFHKRCSHGIRSRMAELAPFFFTVPYRCTFIETPKIGAPL